MAPPRIPSRARVIWLSRLLLVVVVGLGVVGLFLLRQDRHQAQTAAELLAQALADSLAHEGRSQIGRSIEQYTLDADAARNALIRVAYAEPDAATNAASAPDRFPGTNLDNLPRTTFLVRADGRAEVPDFPATPETPDWLLTTPRDLMVRWEAVERAVRTSGEATEEIAQLQMSQGFSNVRPLQANVQLICAELAGPAKDAQANQLRGVAGGYWDQTTPSGVQVGDVATFQAIESAGSERAVGELIAELVAIGFRHPSFMTERLLRALEDRVRTDYPSLTNRMEAARTLWRIDQNTRPLLKQWHEHGSKPADVVRGRHGAEPYFVFSRPSPFVLTNVVIDHRLSRSTTNVVSGVNHVITIVPRSILDDAAQRSATQMASRWPRYLAAEFELLGQRFGATPRAPGVTHRWDSEAILASKTESLGGLVGPSLLTVTVRLGNPELLYATQQRRVILFGALIVLVTLVAAVGAWQLQRNLRAQLALNEQKSNFVSSVSHELRAPIASVRLMAESLERGRITEPAKQREYFRLIGQETRRLSSLITNVLDFARIDQGRKQYDFEPTDLRRLINETVRLMRPYAEERGIRLETSNIEHRTSNIELVVDGRAIQQALVNLMDNAIKHSPKGETVTVALETRNTQHEPRSKDPSICNLHSAICIHIEDRGPGIPAAEHEKIFERFHRLGLELRRETQGVGIGLSIVKHIVEAHGGRVCVESEVGHGSRFTIELAAMKSEGRDPRSE